MKALNVLAFLFICCTAVSGEEYTYVEDYFIQNIDHFNFLSIDNQSNQTYPQRFLYNTTWWDKGRGPIFFYAGNEGDIVGFWSNTGFIFKAAKQFKALVVFAEHRYYGKSLPFGERSFDGEKIGFLGVEQALADYAYFIKSFKQNFGAENCPVIAFGGSYGGMLAAYMRFKYPNVVHGAIAASAPIYIVSNKISGDEFFKAVSKDFRTASSRCEKDVRSGFSQIEKWTTTFRGFEQISEAFHLCEVLSEQDYDHFLRWVRNAFVIAAMMDYPYPAKFMANFPAYPVKAMCNALQSGSRPIDGLYNAAALFYNSSGAVDCFKPYDEYIYCADPTGCGLGDDSSAWDYQACTEMNLQGGTTGKDDIFPPLPFNSGMKDEYCMKKWQVKPRNSYLDVMLWGTDISSSSNIVFSNGNLDPWSVGGILKNISDTIVAVMVDGGAHHLDLREDNPKDPQSVRDARNFELQNIEMWIQDYYRKLSYSANEI